MNTVDLHMRKLYQRFEKSPAGFIKLNEEMQKQYPGNYKITEGFRPDIGYWGPIMTFEDDKEELLFKLKYA